MTFFPKFRSESGMTLIETMASLTLLSVVILLASGFLMNSNDNRQTIATAAQHQHETTVFVQKLRTAYVESTGTGELPIPDLPEGLAIDMLAINGAITNPASPAVGINFEAPLSLDVTTVTDTGETLTVQTSWRPTSDTTLKLTP